MIRIQCNHRRIVRAFNHFRNGLWQPGITGDILTEELSLKLSSFLMLKFSEMSLLTIEERFSDQLLRLGLCNVEFTRLSPPSEDISSRLIDIFIVLRVALDR